MPDATFNPLVDPDEMTCGHCGRSWNAKETPTPSGRCPFEYDHEDDEEPVSPAVQFEINGDQVDALTALLEENRDGDPVLFTRQGSGDLVVAFSLLTFTINAGGEVVE